MGSTTIHDFCAGGNVQKAFEEAVSQARYEYGNAGYTGTMAEKGSYEVVTRTPMPAAVANVKADELINTRFGDKWGPVGAIPVINDTRQVSVDGFAYDTRADDLVEIVRPLVKLGKGETIKDVQVHAYQAPSGRWGSRSTRRTECAATVIVNRVPLARTEGVTVKVPMTEQLLAMKDHERETAIRALAREQATQQVRPRKGETVVHAGGHGNLTYQTKTQAVASKGKPVTRHVIGGVRSPHSTWKTGFESQAQARQWATDFAKANPTWAGQIEIDSVTRREGGAALVTVTNTPVAATVEVQVLIRTATPAPTTPDGWLFFGWASC